MYGKLSVIGLAALVAAAVGCSKQTAAPTSPSDSALSTPGSGLASTLGLSAGADGSTVKVTAPTLQSPANGATFDKGVHSAVLTATASKGKYADLTVSNRFELYENGQLIANPLIGSGGDTVAWNTGNIDYKTTFTWRVRGEAAGGAGPWSPTFSFTTGEVLQPRRNANDYGGKIPRSVIMDDLNSTVYDVAAANSKAVQNSCLGDRNNISFPIKLLTVLRQQYDNRWGFNCIRGNCNDPAAKVITYHYSPGPSEDSTDVYIFQVISGACQVEAVDETAITVNAGTIGRYSLLPDRTDLDRSIFTNLIDY